MLRFAEVSERWSNALPTIFQLSHHRDQDAENKTTAASGKEDDHRERTLEERKMRREKGSVL